MSHPSGLEYKVGINAGSGQQPFTSTPEVKWINVDAQPKWHADVCCNADELGFLRDGTVDYFVLSHTAEHFGCGEAKSLISEAYRVLRPGGLLIVSVPDMRELARGWLAGRISTQIYLTCVYGAYMGDEADRHRWGFDHENLVEFLEKAAPWSSVGGHDWRSIPGMDLARDWWILGANAIK